jgi:hypothetical protein
LTKDEALKLALEALETCGDDEWHTDDDYGMTQVYDDHKVSEAITAIKEALAQPAQEPDRQTLQANGTHPAPCARHCEATAFNIVIRHLEAQLAQPAQEPVAWGVFEGNLHDLFLTQAEAQEMAALKGSHAKVRPLYTTPPQRPWVGLTDDEIQECWDTPLTPYGMQHAKEMVAKLKEKNT